MASIHGRGCHAVPDYVAKNLDPDLIALLKEDGHGLSFPCTSTVQLRLQRDLETITTSFAYREYGSHQNAIEAAMRVNKALRREFGEHSSKRDYVYYRERVRTDRGGIIEYAYDVRLPVNRKLHVKKFSMGHRKPSPDKQFHAYRTAKLYSYIVQCHGLDFNRAWFKQWKERRLYCDGYVPFDWKNT